MTESLPTAPLPTQSRHPFKAVLRTLAAAVPVLIVIAENAPGMAEVADLTKYPWIIGGLTVCAAITRILAIPKVNAVFRRYFPPLAADSARPVR